MISDDDTEFERISIKLIPKSSEALKRLSKTGLNKTDLVNRAIQLYDLVEEATLDGKTLAFIREGSSEIEVLRLL